jgi:hypothetical protein
MSLYLRQIFLECFNAPIGIQSWRHLAQALLSSLKIFVPEDEAELQAGHSVWTGSSIYGDSNLDLPRGSKDIIETFFVYSVKWHRIFGFSDGVILPIAERDSLLHTILTKLNELDRKLDQHLVKTGMSKDHVIYKSLGPLTPAQTPIRRVSEHVDRIDSRVTIDLPNFSRFKKTKTTFARKDVLETLKGMHNNQGMCFLEGQWEAFDFMLNDSKNRQEDGLIILPTGGGKSALYQVASILESEKISVIVIPLVALMADALEKCRNLNLTFTRWTATSSIQSGLVFVGLADIAKSPFQAFLKKGHMDGSISRIVVDEAHLIDWQTFHSGFQNLHILRCVPVPLVFLTATITQVTISKLKSLFSLVKLRIIRICTLRLNHSYWVFSCHGSQAFDVLQNTVNELIKGFADAERGIIFVMDKESGTRIASSVSFPTSFFHGGLQIADKERMLQDFKVGTTKWIVATSAFGVGVDIPNVSSVIALGAYSSIDLIQFFGRGGRNKQHTHCILIVDDVKKQPEDMRNFIDEKVCRRIALHSGLSENVAPCQELPGASLCDICFSSAPGMSLEFSQKGLPCCEKVFLLKPQSLRSTDQLNALDQGY